MSLEAAVSSEAAMLPATGGVSSHVVTVVSSKILCGGGRVQRGGFKLLVPGRAVSATMPPQKTAPTRSHASVCLSNQSQSVRGMMLNEACHNRVIFIQTDPGKRAGGQMTASGGRNSNIRPALLLGLQKRLPFSLHPPQNRLLHLLLLLPFLPLHHLRHGIINQLPQLFHKP